MRTMARCLLLLVALTGCGVVLCGMHASKLAAVPTARQSRTPILVTRIYPGPDGQTHAEELDVKLGPSDIPVMALPGLEKSPTVAAKNAYFVRFAPGFFEDWHNAHARRYVITLSGRGEVELGGGQKITLEPGRVLLAEDLTGKGHITRALTPDWTAVFVQLEQ